MARQVALTRIQQQQERSGKVLLTPPVNVVPTQQETTGDECIALNLTKPEMALSGSSSPAPTASRDQVERSLLWAADICRVYPQVFSLIYIIFRESNSPAEALAWFRNLIQRSMDKRSSIWQPWNLA
ncbi:uncharacterized protein LOC119110339 [Pollicipes pollicipes]|uniref:uncharacterized protein LOC119110339 n=1 Tax=Pollicipes pollicipes TaxID=41117 RepID=UPI001885813E|nr:uncharacterized protein LOC119110339 [Pollicipes pollicipes]